MVTSVVPATILSRVVTNGNHWITRRNTINLVRELTWTPNLDESILVSGISVLDTNLMTPGKSHLEVNTSSHIF